MTIIPDIGWRIKNVFKCFLTRKLSWMIQGWLVSQELQFTGEHRDDASAEFYFQKRLFLFFFVFFCNCFKAYLYINVRIGRFSRRPWGMLETQLDHLRRQLNILKDWAHTDFEISRALSNNVYVLAVWHLDDIVFDSFRKILLCLILILWNIRYGFRYEAPKWSAHPPWRNKSPRKL